MILTDGLLYKENEKIGIDELQWLQAERDERERALRVQTMLTYGLALVRLPGGAPDKRWSVDDDDDDGTLTIRVGDPFNASPASAVAVDHEGYIIEQGDDEDIITMPNDGVWYTIVVDRVATQYDPGTLSVTAASNVVIGTGTAFTRYSGETTSGYGRGTKVRIDAADTSGGNAGTYIIDVIVSDTEIHLTTPIAGANEAGIIFTIAGDYATATPADPDIHQRSVPRFSRVALSREPTAGRIPLCDVKRDDAAGPPKCVFVDRRHQRQYRTTVPEGARSATAVNLQIPVRLDITADSFAAAAQKNVVFADGVNAVTTTAVAPIAASVTLAGRLLALVASNTDGLIHPMVETDAAVFTSAFVATGATFAGTQPTLCRLPVASGYTHVALYIVAGVLLQRFTSDNGTTWSGPATVLDPTLNDPADTASFPHVLMLLNGRLCCAVRYFDSPAASFTVVTVTSDDHGATWQTNGGVGYPAVGDAPAHQSSRPFLAQEATGRIYIATVRDSTDISLNWSDDPGGRFSGGIGIPYNVIDRLGVFEQVANPCLWISPGGDVVVVYQAYDLGTTTAQIRYAVLGYNPDFGLGASPLYVIHERRLLIVDTGLGAFQDLGMNLVQEQAGHLALSFITTAPAVDRGYLLRLTPCAVEIQEGGEQRFSAI